MRSGAVTSDLGVLAERIRPVTLAREQRLALIMLDTVDFPVAFLGAIKAGIVPVPLEAKVSLPGAAFAAAITAAVRAALRRSKKRRRSAIELTSALLITAAMGAMVLA